MKRKGSAKNVTNDELLKIVHIEDGFINFSYGHEVADEDDVYVFTDMNENKRTIAKHDFIRKERMGKKETLKVKCMMTITREQFDRTWNEVRRMPCPTCGLYKLSYHIQGTVCNNCGHRMSLFLSKFIF